MHAIDTSNVSNIHKMDRLDGRIARPEGWGQVLNTGKQGEMNGRERSDSEANIEKELAPGGG
jgi:hypothetical protein